MNENNLEAGSSKVDTEELMSKAPLPAHRSSSGELSSLGSKGSDDDHPVIKLDADRKSVV